MFSNYEWYKIGKQFGGRRGGGGALVPIWNFAKIANHFPLLGYDSNV